MSRHPINISVSIVRTNQDGRFSPLFLQHLFHGDDLVVHSLSFRCFSWNQAKSSLSPDPLAVTSPSQQALSTWAPLHELAHDQDHACDSQEETWVNRTAKGNAGYEPRRR